MGNSQRTETSVEFRKLQEDTETRKKCLDRIHEAMLMYYDNLTKKKEFGDEKGKKLIQQQVSITLLTFGSILTDQSEYGRSLMKVGQMEEKIALEKAMFVTLY